MSRKLSAAPCAGLTLIELVIVLAVLSIVVMVTATPMRNVIEATRLRSEAARVQLAINLARSEAVARNLPISLCPSSYSRSQELKCDGDYRDGWLVFAGAGRKAGSKVEQAELIRAFEPMPDGYWLSKRSGTALLDSSFTYFADGTAQGNLTMMVCSARSSDTWSVVINQVGRARLARNWGSCPSAV